MRVDVNEQAKFFSNRDGRRLFSVVNRVTAPKALRLGVVFCHPFGEEKQKSYRSFVKFARRLASAGIPSIRFDSLGVGDSEGDAREAGLRQQVRDIRDAADVLAADADIDRVALIGVRLGATAAALAASADSRVSSILLVSPVVNGAACWEAMLRQQQMSFMTRGIKTKKREQMLADLQTEGHIELDANLVSAVCAEEIRGVDLCADLGDYRGRCALTAVGSDGPSRTEVEALASAYRSAGCEVTEWLDEERDFWANKVLYEGYSPTSLFERTVEWLGGDGGRG